MDHFFIRVYPIYPRLILLFTDPLPSRRPEQRQIYLEDLCFQAQLAAEKALKAVYRSKDIRFGYTHDLAELMDLLDEHDVAIPEPVDAAVILTRYAVQTRYPGVYPPLTEEDWNEAINLATQVTQWASSLMG
ncbi:HEPN domain-containing protein [Holophaga foetida]|uniref:HEPN domain-containing protein n=1 Tax=Holophaga foetida TaxID=35839 RepID=UPI0006963DC1|nr:HEPN domain-containing protein [Holophaga foetida]